MPEWLIQVLVCGAIYGGIRADLKSMKESITEAKLIGIRAHDRIDGLLKNH